MLLFVNYHYIRETLESKYPGIHGLTPVQLRAQLETIGRRCDFLKAGELMRLVEGGGAAEGDLCMVTFDDGLREQYEIALPILESMGLEALFNVNGDCIEGGTVSVVHKIHWLKSLMPPEAFARGVSDAMEREGVAVPVTLEEFKPVDGQNIYDSHEVKYVKYLLNHILSQEQQARVVDGMYRARGVDEAAHSAALYLSEEMVGRLGRRGMIGSHGYSHNPKNSLSEAGLLKDFQDNQRFIRRVSGRGASFVSYPYGGRTAVSRAVAACAMREGHTVGVTMERAVNLGTAEPLLLGRLDANDAPGGKSPLLLRSAGDSWEMIPPATWGRKWFFNEEAIEAKR